MVESVWTWYSKKLLSIRAGTRRGMTSRRPWPKFVGLTDVVGLLTVIIGPNVAFLLTVTMFIDREPNHDLTVGFTASLKSTRLFACGISTLSVAFLLPNLAHPHFL